MPIVENVDLLKLFLLTAKVLFENYLKAVAVNGKVEKNKTKKLHPSIAKLKGIINLPKNYDYKKELGKILLERYNKSK